MQLRHLPAGERSVERDEFVALVHAALFGVNPWRLQSWMGHKRIDETMLYVHVAGAHGRELPEAVREASASHWIRTRACSMLGARGKRRQ